MARVPQVLPREGLLQPLRVPVLSLDAGPGVFGADVARGLGNIGNVTTDIGLDVKRQKDAAEATEIIGTAQAAMLDALKNPETGILTRRLKEAGGASAETAKIAAKIWKDAEAKATSAATRLVVNESGRRQTAQDVEAAANHEISEGQRYADWSAGKVIEASIERSALTPMNAGVAEQAAADVSAAVAMRLGSSVSPEELKSEQAEAVSKVHAARLSALFAQGANADAVSLYGEVSSKMTAADQETFSKAVNSAKDLVKEQEATDALFAKYPNDPQKGLDAARSEYSGVDEENITRALTNRYNEAFTLTQRVDNADLDAAWSVFAQTGRVGAIPRDLYARVLAKNPQAITAMRNEAERKARGAGEPEPDFKKIGEWMYATPEWKASPGGEPFAFLQGKAPSSIILRFMDERVGIQNQQRGLTDRGGAVRGPSMLNQTIDGRIATQAQTLTLSTEQAGALKSYVWERIKQYQDLNQNKNPDEKTLDAIMDEALIKGSVVRYGLFGIDMLSGDTEARRFEVAPAELPAFVPEAGDVAPATPAIPAAEREEIIKALRSAGVPVTEDEIRSMYAEKNGVAP